MGSSINALDQLKGLSKHVMLKLGKGHRESIYHKALVTSLNRAGVPHRSEVVTPIMFMGDVVGYGKADLVIDDLVVEIKATAQPLREASPQLQKYVESLQRTEKRPFRGVILNFNKSTGFVELRQEHTERGLPRKQLTGNTTVVSVATLEGLGFRRKSSGMFGRSLEHAKRPPPLFVKRMKPSI